MQRLKKIAFYENAGNEKHTKENSLKGMDLSPRLVVFWGGKALASLGMLLGVLSSSLCVERSEYLAASISCDSYMFQRSTLVSALNCALLRHLDRRKGKIR